MSRRNGRPSSVQPRYELGGAGHRAAPRSRGPRPCRSARSGSRAFPSALTRRVALAAHHVQRDVGLLAHHPAVVAGRHVEEIARRASSRSVPSSIFTAACPLDHEAHVLDLAELSPAGTRPRARTSASRARRWRARSSAARPRRPRSGPSRSGVSRSGRSRGIRVSSMPRSVAGGGEIRPYRDLRPGMEALDELALALRGRLIERARAGEAGAAREARERGAGAGGGARRRRCPRPSARRCASGCCCWPPGSARSSRCWPTRAWTR